MQRRTLALILSLAMLVGLVSAAGIFSVSASAAQWTADETGNAAYTTIARGTGLTAYMAEQGVTESALNYHMNPLSVRGEDGQTAGRKGSTANEPNGFPRQLCDGDMGSASDVSSRIVYYCTSGKLNYYTYDLLQNSRLTDFVVAGSQMDNTTYLLKNVKIYVSDAAYDGTAETLGTEVFRHMGETSKNVNDYNYHVRLNTPVTGRYVTFAVGFGDQYTQLRLGELAAYGTRLSYDTLGNAVRELRAAQDIPTYANALISATGRMIGGGGIPFAGNLLNGVVSALTTNVDFLMTAEETTTYAKGDSQYKSGTNFLDKAKGKAWITVHDDESYTVQNIPLAESKYTETVTGDDGTETTVTKYKRFIRANIGWNGQRIAVRSDYANEDRNILGTENQFYYDLGGVTDVEKVMVASGVALQDQYLDNVASTVGDGTLNTWNSTLENTGAYIVSGIKLYVADTLGELMANGAFLESALVADFTQERGNTMDTAVELTLQNVQGRYIGFTLTTPTNNLRLSELAVKTGEKHGNWHIDTAAAADMAAESLLNTVTVLDTNLKGGVANVVKLGDGDGNVKGEIDMSSNDGKNADGDTMACIPGTDTEIKGTSGWAQIWFELDSEVSIDSFLLMGSLGDTDNGGNFGRQSLCRNRTIAYYRIYVGDSKDTLFTDDKLVVDCNNVGDNVLGSNPASGAYDAFRNYLNAPVKGRFIGVKLTTGAYQAGRVGEFHVYGKAEAKCRTWTDCSDSTITVPAAENNLLADAYKEVLAYEQHALKAGQEGEFTRINPEGSSANFANVFDGKTWAGYQKNEDGSYVTNEKGWKIEVDANSKWTPMAYDTAVAEDETKTNYPNYIWLDFDLGLRYNIDGFFHAAADRGASEVDFFVTDRTVQELAAEGAEPDVHMTGNVKAGSAGTATHKTLLAARQGSHVIIRLKGDLNAGMYQMWVSELAVTGKAAESIRYAGASKRLSSTNDLRFMFRVAVEDAAYAAGDPLANGDYSRDISDATVTVDGESRTVVSFGAIVTNRTDDWEAALDSVSAATGKYTKVVEAYNLYTIHSGYVTYTAVVKDIPDAYVERVIHARPYVAYLAADGSTQYLYGEIVSSSIAAFNETA